jgi:hypothetical protein
MDHRLAGNHATADNQQKDAERLADHDLALLR